MITRSADTATYCDAGHCPLIESVAARVIVVSALGILALCILITLCVWQSRQHPAADPTHTTRKDTP